MFRRLYDEKLSTPGMPVRLSGDEVDILRRAVEWFEYTAEKRLRQKIAGKANIERRNAQRTLSDDPKAIANRERVKKHRELKNK